MKMIDLLPCPFCGSKPQMHPSSDWNISLTGNTWFVWCHKCFTRGDYHMCAEDAAIAWNTRVERTCKPVERDGVMRCPDCDYPLGIMSVPAYCAGCGAKVVG